MVDINKINSSLEDLTKLMLTIGTSVPAVGAAAVAISMIVKAVTGNAGLSPSQIADIIEVKGKAELNATDDSIARMREMIGA